MFFSIKQLASRSKALFNFFYDIYILSKLQRRSACKIIDFKIPARQVTIQYRGMNAIISLSFADAIRDCFLIDSLPSIQACWLGYHFINSMNKVELERSAEKIDKMKLSLRSHERSQFKIISFSFTSRELTYRDVRSHAVFGEKIAKAAQNKFFLDRIHSSQAMYIGILAGYEAMKYGDEIFQAKAHFPSLYVVK